MSKSLRILLIEDSEDDVLLLTRELRRNGYLVEYQRVDTANEMRTALEKKRWDVVICDYVMPHFSAPDALKLLQSTGLDLPFIVVSGAMGEETAVAVMRAGAHDYLTKDKLVRLVPAIEREIAEAANRQDRRKAQELVLRLGRILDNSSNEIYVIDVDSKRILQTNRSACENLGYTAQEMGAMNAFDLLDETVASDMQQRFRELRSGERAEILCQTVHRRRDGSTYPVETRIYLSKSETPPVFVIIAQDITERKKVEAALYFIVDASAKLSSTLNYESIFRNVAQLAIPFLADVCLVDMVEEDDSVRRVASAYLEGEQNILVQELEKHWPKPPHPVFDVIDTGKAVVLGVPSLLIDSLTQAGGHRHVLEQIHSRSYMIVPMLARDKVLGTISFVITNSDRQYGNSDLALAEELSRRAAIAIENAGLFHEAQWALTLRDQFLSIAAHELKTPITALLGNTQLIQRRVVRNNGNFEARDQRLLHVIEQQAHRLSRMVEALLDISRIRNGTLTIERNILDISALTGRIVDEIQPSLERHTLLCNISRQPIFTSGDALRLEQVIQNLIQNAVKYSPSGGQIIVELKQEGMTVEISVTDNGIGIPTKSMPNLFSQFYRADNTRVHQIAGMGLGLYIVREIVALHGGTVEVTSVEGQGSTFRILLPAAVASTVPQPSSQLRQVDLSDHPGAATN